MKVNRKTFLICVVIVLGLAVGITAGYFAYKEDTAKAEYKMIYQNDFNRGSSSYGELQTESYDPKGVEFGYDEAGGMDGTGCITLQNTSPNDARYTYKYSDAVPNAYYRMSAWVRTQNVESGATNGSTAVGANISVLGTYSHSDVFIGNSDWSYIEYYGKTGSDQTEFTVCLRLGFYGGTNTGKVYFDDLAIEQIESLPSGAVSTSMEDSINTSGRVQSNEQHQNTMLTASILLAATLVIFIIAWRYALKRDREAQQLDLISGTAAVSGLSVRSVIFILIGMGFLLRFVMSFTMPQCDIDVNLFQNWGQHLANQGIPNFYAYAKENNLSLDYPPLFLYHLYFIGKISNFAGLAQSAAFDVLLKLPSIIADCVIAYILYRIASKRMSKNWTMIIVAAWLFNPMILLDSACWGQVDSLLTLALLLSAYFIEKDRFAWSAVALAFAITLKPQGIFFVPILGFTLLRQLIREKELPLAKRLLRFGYSIVAFFITAFIIILPFGIKEPNIFTWIFGVYTNTAGGYSYATVNSFNFFYLLGANWVADSTAFMGLTYFAWGMIAIVLLSVLTGVLYIYGKKKNTYVYLLSAMLIYTVATFGPRMHERYFYPAIALLLVAVIYSNNKALFGIYTVLSISNFYTVLEVMTGLSIGGKLIDTDYATASYYYWPPLNTGRTLMTIFNVACAAALIVVACQMIFLKKRASKGSRIWEQTCNRINGEKNEAKKESEQNTPA